MLSMWNDEINVFVSVIDEPKTKQLFKRSTKWKNVAYSLDGSLVTFSKQGTFANIKTHLEHKLKRKFKYNKQESAWESQ